MNQNTESLSPTTKSQNPSESSWLYIKLTSFSGMIGGAIGRFICHPIDTIKAKLYIQRSKAKVIPYREALQLILDTWTKEGVKGFYRGITINVIGAGPAYSLYLTAYEFTKLQFKNQNIFTSSPFLTYIAAGLIAEAISCCLFLPIDVIKERMQVQQNLKAYQYNGSVNAIFTIIKQEGLKGLYRAYGATLGSFGPYSAIYFLIYENMKKFLSIDPKHPSFLQSAFASSTAFLCVTSPLILFIQSSLLTNPLFISKFRMQVQYVEGIHKNSNQANFGYRNQLHGIYTIYQQEGFKALYRGYSARLIYGGSITTVSMAVNEVMRNYLQKKY